MITYTINGPILEIKGIGVYSTQDVAAMYLAAKNDPLLPIPTLLLADIRESTMVHSFSDVRDRLLIIEKQLGLIMAPFMAIVVSGVARDRLAQLYQSRAAETGQVQIEIFTNLNVARDWLLSRG